MKRVDSAPNAVTSIQPSSAAVGGLQTSRLRSGLIFDASETMYPSRLEGFVGGRAQFDVSTRHHFGFVLEGSIVIKRNGLPQQGLQKGMYFSAPGPFEIEGDAKVSVIIREGYRGMFTVGGPIESSGRLCYIDGCSVSQLVPPARLGDPTFQQLVFPPGVDQSQHIHPTIRLGMVISGSGHCRTPDGILRPLRTGDAFMLEERFQHSFVTDRESMSVIAFHPDSDVGPTDDNHPMLSRTFIVGRGR